MIETIRIRYRIKKRERVITRENLIHFDDSIWKEKNILQKYQLSFGSAIERKLLPELLFVLDIEYSRRFKGSLDV